MPREQRTGDVFCMSTEIVELLSWLTPDEALTKKLSSIPDCADEIIGVVGHTTEMGEITLNKCFKTAEGTYGKELFERLKHCAHKYIE